jgi:hypothetical protein
MGIWNRVLCTAVLMHPLVYNSLEVLEVERVHVAHPLGPPGCP